MSSFERVRRAALALPEVTEGVFFDGPEFLFRRKTFALWWPPTRQAILRLDRDHQTFLFEVRPEVFQPRRVGVGTWAYVDLAALEDDEVDELVLEAWKGLAPKKLWATVRDPSARPPPARPPP